MPSWKFMEARSERISPPASWVGLTLLKVPKERISSAGLPAPTDERAIRVERERRAKIRILLFLYFKQGKGNSFQRSDPSASPEPDSGPGAATGLKAGKRENPELN